MVANFSPANTSDDEIVQSLKGSEAQRRAGEELLFRKYAYFIHEGEIKYKLSNDDCFNAYSDSILGTLAAVQAATFQERSSLKTYLFRVFSNKCVDIVRHRTTNRQRVHTATATTDMYLELSDNAKTVLEQMSDRADVNDLRKRLERVGERCSELLLLFSAGNSDKVLAQLLSFKSAAVAKTTRLRCLEKLRQLYELKKHE